MSPPECNARPRWRFLLHKAGDKPAMQRAEATLRRLCQHYLGDGDRYEIRVVDMLQDEAVAADILALPTVVRTSPAPERRVVGDLSKARQAAEWLGLTDAELFNEQ